MATEISPTGREVDQHLQGGVFELGRSIGNTPLYALDKVYRKKGVRICAKLEWQQLGGSVKARPAYEIIKQAILSGELGNGQELLDASSGNTGIAYASIGAALGVPVTLCLPENASPARKKLLNALGAKLIYTSPFDNTDGAQLEARKIKAEQPERFFYADQYSNDNNWRSHYTTTGVEILQQSDQRITHFVAALGTTGTFTGTGRRLKAFDPNIHLTALQPDSILHGLEGWKHLGTAIVPKIHDPKLADATLEVATEDAFELIKAVARMEGLLISPSAAANLAGAIKIAEDLEEGVVVTVFPDNAEKYAEVIDELF
jgi:S-sulfo-L-cysteine synthase (O-acetyl-L-serine-dependent)